MLFKLVLVNNQTTCSQKLLNEFMNFLILMCFSQVCPNQNILPLMPKCFLCFCILSGSYSPLHLQWHCCHPPTWIIAAIPCLQFAPLHSTPSSASSPTFQNLELLLLPVPNSAVTVHLLWEKIQFWPPFLLLASSVQPQVVSCYYYRSSHLPKSTFFTGLHYLPLVQPGKLLPIQFQTSVLVFDICNFYI